VGGASSGVAGRRATIAESFPTAEVSTRATPKLAVRSRSARTRIANASRVTKAPNNMIADATTRSNRFIFGYCAATHSSTGAAMSQ
jgi:hypothetical protein